MPSLHAGHAVLLPRDLGRRGRERGDIAGHGTGAGELHHERTGDLDRRHLGHRRQRGHRHGIVHGDALCAIRAERQRGVGHGRRHGDVPELTSRPPPAPRPSPRAITTTTVPVPVIGDTMFEAAETFVVNLSTPVNATIADSQATGTITNDDAVPALTISDVDRRRGQHRHRDGDLHRDRVDTRARRPMTVNYATANGTATAGSDYVAGSGTLTFAAGVTSQTITVAVNGDIAERGRETFSSNLSAAVNASIGDAQGAAPSPTTIRLPSITIGDVSRDRGQQRHDARRPSP